MRLLSRGPHRHRLLGVAPLRNHASAFYRMAAAAILPKLLVVNVRGLAERGFGVAIGDLVHPRDIRVELAANRRPVCGSRVATVANRRKEIVVDPYQGGSVLGQIAVLRK